jgi:hypothetical protein
MLLQAGDDVEEICGGWVAVGVEDSVLISV